MHYYPALPVGRLILTGADRVKFLHNFCTADVKRIQLGELREAFVLNIKGKLHGHAHVLCREESLELRTSCSRRGCVFCAKTGVHLGVLQKLRICSQKDARKLWSPRRLGLVSPTFFKYYI